MEAAASLVLVNTKPLSRLLMDEREAFKNAVSILSFVLHP
jgi:hypothetical protein